jgi:hypothetical protein
MKMKVVLKKSLKNNTVKSSAFFIMFCVLFLFNSCSKCDDVIIEGSEIIGKWKLTQILIDPGDGSGEFVDYIGDTRTVEFRSNGIIFSNYSLCTPTLDLLNSISHFSIDTKTIIPDNCYNGEFVIHYQKEGDNLVLYYPCDESCLFKFEKNNN